ncbi:hypothetical protein RRF57_007081 [Xylaria bambusicola]|uniref:Secreted protein n=1 Tax=Xylaria bambusicola TaxID=326684 RepID=A0AAN7Z607_9PEZI
MWANLDFAFYTRLKITSVYYLLLCTQAVARNSKTPCTNELQIGCSLENMRMIEGPQCDSHIAIPKFRLSQPQGTYQRRRNAWISDQETTIWWARNADKGGHSIRHVSSHEKIVMKVVMVGNTRYGEGRVET